MDNQPQQNYSRQASDRKPPQDLIAERSLLGSLLLEAERVDDVTDLVGSETFYLQEHRVIFSAIIELHRKRKSIDPVIVADELKRQGTLEECGGMAYIHEILECVPHAAHARHYAELVLERYSRRIILQSASEATRACYDDSDEVTQITGRLEDSLNRVAEGSNVVETDMNSMLLDAMNAITSGRSTGIKVGFHDIDKLTNGFPEGYLSILAARPSVGKSALALTWLLNVAKEGVPCLFMSLEQSRMEVAERMLSQESGICFNEMRNQKPDEATCDLLMQHAGRLGQIPIIVDDRAGRTVQQISAVARMCKRKHGVNLVVIDYLQLITPTDARQNREQQVADVSRRLKLLARDDKLSVVCLAQLNRALESRTDRTPKLSDLRESGSIEADADIVCMLDRPWMADPANEDPRDATLFVNKNRNGPTGKVALCWRGETMSFQPGTFRSESEYTRHVTGNF